MEEIDIEKIIAFGIGLQEWIIKNKEGIAPQGIICCLITCATIIGRITAPSQEALVNLMKKSFEESMKLENNIFE